MTVSNTMAIRLQNAMNIIHDLECHSEITNTEIAYKQKLSIPTISNIVNILKNSNMVISAGIGESSGGRKPNYLALNPQYHHFIGVSIAKHTVYMTLIDFKGQILSKEKNYIRFSDDAQYWDVIRNLVQNMVQKTDIACHIGIALPGFVQADEGVVTGTDTLGVSKVSLDHIYEILGGEVSVNDSCSLAAKAQIFGKEYVSDSFFVLLSRRVSGTLIYDRDVFKLKSSSIDIGAMLISSSHGENNSFYDYCTASRIIEYLKDNHCTVDNYEGFFEEIEAGNAGFAQMWDDYLKHLSVALYNIYSFFKMDIVIGGEMAKYILPYSDTLNAYVNEISSNDLHSIHVHCSSYGAYDDAYGAALESRTHFLNREIPELLKSSAALTPQRPVKRRKK